MEGDKASPAWRVGDAAAGNTSSLVESASAPEPPAFKKVPPKEYDLETQDSRWSAGQPYFQLQTCNGFRNDNPFASHGLSWIYIRNTRE